MAKRIKLQDRSGVQLLPLTRAELVQFTYITGLVPQDGTLSVQAALEALNAKANNISEAEGNNLTAIQALQQKLNSFEQAQDSVKNYVNAQDTAYLALAYAEAAAKASAAQTNAYAEAASKASAAQTAAYNYADGKFLVNVKLNNEFVTVQSDTNGRYVDLGSIATSTGLQSLSDRVTAIEGTYITATDSNNADTAIITAYEAADSAIITAYTAADTAIITAYEAADSALSDRIDNLESSYGVTVTETAGSGDILKGYQIAQNGVTLGTINIPKDMVATQGEVVYCTKSGDTYTEVASTTSGAIACIKMTVGNGNSTDSFYVEVADLIEYNGVQSNSEITLSDTGHVIEATVGEIAASKIVYNPGSGDPVTGKETVAQAITRIEGELGNGGSVATQIQTAIEALDADLDASGTAQHSGTFVVSGVTEVDGVITAVDSVEVEAAGAAATAKATIDDYTVNGKKISTSPTLYAGDIAMSSTDATTTYAAITALQTADGNSVKTVNGQSPTSGAVTVNASQIDTVNTYKLSGDASAATHNIDAVLAEAVFFVDTTGAGTYGDTTI